MYQYQQECEEQGYPTMVVSIGDCLDFRYMAACAMITLESLEWTLVEEAILLLGSAALLQIMDPNIEGLAGPRVHVSGREALLSRPQVSSGVKDTEPVEHA